MSRRCELTAKGPQVGHKVSHSNTKTKRRFLPNLCNVTFISDVLGRNVRLRVSTNAIKSVDHRGGLDAFLIKAEGRPALAPRARPEARDREEEGGGAGGEGELSLAAHAVESLERPGRKTRPFLFWRQKARYATPDAPPKSGNPAAFKVGKSWTIRAFLLRGSEFSRRTAASLGKSNLADCEKPGHNSCESGGTYNDRRSDNNYEYERRSGENDGCFTSGGDIFPLSAQRKAQKNPRHRLRSAVQSIASFLTAKNLFRTGKSAKDDPRNSF